MRRVFGFAVAVLGTLAVAAGASAHVLLVGKYHGVAGKYKTLQAAVKAAKPGDWILIGPGDYKTKSFSSVKGANTFPAGILITKARIHLRGMNRGSVIVDGTKGGSACNAKASEQNFGASSSKGTYGVNGIMVWKADGVTVQNMTVCNFLGGSGGDGVVGNEVWWNGGAGGGKVGGWGFDGSYLNATSSYYTPKANGSINAYYGIFSSDWSGGTWTQDYASNFSDSGFYIGACRQICNNVVNQVWAEWSALGYSGSNSGGSLVVKNSQFDNNNDGFDTNSQNGDNPPPQDGACPNNGISPITHTHSCWVFMNNNVHDNNNPNVPRIGAASQGPVGTGMSVSGGRFDTIMNNRFSNNKAWGIVVIPYPDSGGPCSGGTMNDPILGNGSCLFDDWGDAITGNTFSGNGGYGHPTNGDIGWLNLQAGNPTPCFNGNTEQGGGTVTTSPAGLQTSNPTCTGATVPTNGNGTFLNELLCDTQVSLNPPNPPSCPSGGYPRASGTPVMHPLPKHLPTMPNPCTGVPSNAWCSAKKK